MAVVESSAKVFKCPCNASARFIPVYRFNESGKVSGVMTGPLCQPTIKCVNCGQLYRWVPDGDHGGWHRQSALDDLIELEAVGG